MKQHHPIHRQDDDHACDHPALPLHGWRKALHSGRAACVFAAFHSGRGLRKTLRICLKTLFVCYFLFAALFLVLRYVVLPNLENYKSEIEQFASAKMGRVLSIQSLEANWQGFNPQIALKGIVIRDQQSQAVLTLPEVNTTLSWWSLAVLDLRFAEVEIIAPQLNIRRNSNGVIEVAGFSLQLDGKGDGGEAGLNWLLAQHQIKVVRGQVNWDDQLRANPPLSLTAVNFVLNNHWREHQFAMQATPPVNMAAPVDVRGQFQQAVFATKKSDLSSWSGELYSDLKQADLPVIHQYFPFPFKLDKGLGSVRSWIKLKQGRLADFTADVHLQDVIGKFRKDLPLLDMAQVSGRIIASEQIKSNYKYLSWLPGQAGHSLALVNFSMKTRDGLVLPATTLKETFTPGENGQCEKVELYTQSLDLHSLANFAEHLPIPADQRRLLIDVAPKGVLKDFTARWQGSFPDISSYSIKGQFSNLEMQALKAQLARPKTGKLPAKAAVPAIPGFDNLSGYIDANDKGGTFTLDSTDLLLQLPSYFVDPLMPFKRLKMQARWQFQQNDQLQLQIQQMEFEQDGAIGNLSGKHSLSMRQADLGEVDLNGHLQGFDIKTINRYIPAQTPEHLRDWLSHALLDGEANDVVFRLKGALAHFPFQQKDPESGKQGEFFVKGNLRNGKLNFLPNVFAKDGVAPFWPVIDSIKGSFIFERGRMEIRADTAATNNVPLNKVKVIIPDLLEHNAVLQIDGNASGNLQTMLNYLKASPVDDWLANFLHDTTATGNGLLNLKLNLPLNSIIDSKVNGLLQLNNAETILQTDLPLISMLNGKIEFNEHGLNLNNLKANLLGGAVQANGGSQKDGSIKIKLEGLATAEGIQKHLANLEVSNLFDSLKGETKYTTQIYAKKRQTEVVVESDLQGLAWNLPAPLTKTANELAPMRFEILPDASADQNEIREQLKLSVGNRFNAHYQRKKTLEKNARWNVVRAAVAVNSPAILPDSGLNLHVQTKSLNVDEWRRVLDAQVKNHMSPTTEKTNLLEPKSPVDFAQYVEPTSLSVITDEIYLFGKKMDNIVLGASNQGGLWQSNLDSTQASGFISWNGFGKPQSPGQITARLSRLMIPKSAAGDVGDLLEAKNTTKQIPSLDIQVDNFELFNKKLGHLTLNASNTLAAQGREWNIDKLVLKNDDAELSATGQWAARGTDSQTKLQYVLDIANSGKLLDRFDFTDVLRGGKGKLEGDLQWTGLPFDLDIPSLSGQLQLKLAAGQFLKVDPGAAKLLGVLSMQSLPRRFTLDFRDVFSDGFAFDSIVGTAKISHGIATTDNLKMSSVNAAVLMEGHADIAKESQDLHVAVIPDFNAGAASVVYGLAVNPVIGLGTFLAQLFFRDPLKRAFTYEYQITGPWMNPIVTKIENKERQQILEKQKAEQKVEQNKAKAEVK
ncbi:YhdP family protein [Undibacterium flavidum]|uniref:TIGR02099 family protein n=1 Tax=Undibacterium flavidum TaxID=2762297 RepID=A0ABR6YHH6_9BURK|nr:YhdP family protein [Undibacterium flavidum]MBC3875993.1 TIGR02099 family protein [Undibacterium flavidum]